MNRQNGNQATAHVRDTGAVSVKVVTLEKIKLILCGTIFERVMKEQSKQSFIFK